MASRLQIDYAGQRIDLAPDDVMTFGRAADLVIDDTNRHLHRVTGRLFTDSSVWWLENVGTILNLLVADADTRSSSLVAPGRRTAITFPKSVIRFRAGQSDYELAMELIGEHPVHCPREPDFLTDTIGFIVVPLTDEQRLLLVALSEQLLLDPHSVLELPTNRQLAQRLDWSITKFNRKLDNLCQKYAKAGVEGLHGSSSELATDRRRRLAEHVIEHAVVVPEDLATLP